MVMTTPTHMPTIIISRMITVTITRMSTTRARLGRRVSNTG